jgi:hypothetical protein
MRTFPMLLCLVCAAAASRAQVELAPPKAVPSEQAEAMSKLDLDGLKKKLADDREWFAAARELGRRALDDEPAVVQLAVDFWTEMEKDPVARERGFVVVAEINRRNWKTIRRTRLEEAIADLGDVLERARKAAGQVPDAKAASVQEELDTIARKLAQLRKTVADLDEQDPESGAHEPLEFGGDDAQAQPPTDAPPASRPHAQPEKPGDGNEKKREPGEHAAARALPPAGHAGPAGDARRVPWILPFRDALAQARRTGRVILCKPILGGSNTPDPGGLPCGGRHDCEGSW